MLGSLCLCAVYLSMNISKQLHVHTTLRYVALHCMTSYQCHTHIAFFTDITTLQTWHTLHTCIHTCMHTYIECRLDVYRHACLLASVPTQTSTHTHTHTRARAHAQTHTHTSRVCAQLVIFSVLDSPCTTVEMALPNHIHILTVSPSFPNPEAWHSERSRWLCRLACGCRFAESLALGLRY